MPHFPQWDSHSRRASNSPYANTPSLLMQALLFYQCLFYTHSFTLSFYLSSGLPLLFRHSILLIYPFFFSLFQCDQTISKYSFSSISSFHTTPFANNPKLHLSYMPLLLSPSHLVTPQAPLR